MHVKRSHLTKQLTPIFWFDVETHKSSDYVSKIQQPTKKQKKQTPPQNQKEKFNKIWQEW